MPKNRVFLGTFEGCVMDGDGEGRSVENTEK